LSLARGHGDVLLVVAAGGALGSLGRWAVGRALPWDGAGFPWGTFVENVSGALALGVIMVLLLELRPTSRYLRPFVGVGLLGGYTTFSAVMLETMSLMTGGDAATAVVYLGATLVLGVLAVWTGVLAGGLVLRGVIGRGPGDGPDTR